MKPKEFDALIEAMLRAALAHGLVSEEVTPFGATGWRLNDAVVLFRSATPQIDPNHPSQHAFFRDFYANLAGLLRDPVHPLFGFEAREHTAQVDGDRRAVRERRFRYGKKEREELLRCGPDDNSRCALGDTVRHTVSFCVPFWGLAC